MKRIETASPRLDRIEADVDLARAEIAEARVGVDPTVSYDREQLFPDDETEIEQIARLSWPIDLSGRRGRRASAAEAGVRAAERDAAIARFELVADALDAYHDAAYSRARLAALSDARAGLAQAVETMRTRVRADDASRYDLDRLELELFAHEDALATAEADLERAERELGRIVGDEGRVAAADPLSLPGDPPPLDELLRGAARAHPAHAAAVARAEQASLAESAASRWWIPPLWIHVGLKTTDAGAGAATGYVAGVVVDLPLFDRGQGDRARARATRRRAAAEARILERELPSRIRAAHADLARRLAQARAFVGEQTPRAASLVRRAEVSHREGERPLVDLVDVYRIARETRLREAELIRAARRSELELWRALGRRP